MSRGDARKRAVELLDLVRVPNAAERIRDYPHEFSGGMRQRVMIAAALAMDPEVLIADEPTTALDVTVQAQILRLLAEIQAERRMGLVLITHDLGVVATVADDVTVMYAGHAVEQATMEQVFTTPSHPYTRALLRSMPSMHTDRDDLIEDDERPRLPVIPGRPPRPGEITVGCPYQPRCDEAEDICRTTAPPMEELAGAQFSRCHFAVRVREGAAHG
jgi:oligopeptide/dipeptide ABC transporter ATP-binding protein